MVKCIECHFNETVKRNPFLKGRNSNTLRLVLEAAGGEKIVKTKIKVNELEYYAKEYCVTTRVYD